MCTSWSSANQISNFKFSAFFRVLFALWSLKYPHPKSQQTPRVSTELEMVVKLSYSFIPLQKDYKEAMTFQLETYGWRWKCDAKQLISWTHAQTKCWRKNALLLCCPLLPLVQIYFSPQPSAIKICILWSSNFRNSSFRARRCLCLISGEVV